MQSKSINVVEQTCRMLGMMTESLIGSSQSIKCVSDEGQEIFTNCVHHLLNNLHIQQSIGDVIIDAVRNHHERYTCSCKTLLTLTLYWVKVMDQLRKQGIPLSLILTAFHQAVELCVEQIQQHAVPTRSILTAQDLQQQRPLPTRDIQCAQDLQQQRSLPTRDIQSAQDSMHHTSETQQRHILARADSMAGSTQVEETSVSVSDKISSTNKVFTGHYDKPTLHDVHPSKNLTNFHVEAVGYSQYPNVCDTENLTLNLEDVSGFGTENDDVGWFFEGGEAPKAPDFQREVVDVLQQFGGTLMEDFEGNDDLEEILTVGPDINNEKRCVDSKHDVDDIRKHAAFRNEAFTHKDNIPTIKHPPNDFEFDSCFDEVRDQGESGENIKFPFNRNDKFAISSLNIEDSDSDFDTCFDDIPHVQKQLSASTNKKKNFDFYIKSDVDGTKSDNTSRTFCDKDRDEFESCFEEIEFSVGSSGNCETTREVVCSGEHSVIAPGGFAERLSKVNNGVRTDDVKSPAETNDKMNERREIDSKLADIFSRKSPLDLKAKITNRSRHFRTVTSSVDELQKSQDLSHLQDSVSELSSQSHVNRTDIQNVAIEDENKLQKLDILLKNFREGTSKPSATNLLNQSRYYKTFQSSVLEMKKMANSDRTNNQNAQDETSDDLKPEISDLPSQDLINICDIPVMNTVVNSSKKSDIGVEVADEMIMPVSSLVNMLSHGATEVAPLVAEVCMKQNQGFRPTSLETSRIHTHVVVSPLWEKSMVISGGVVNTSANQLLVLSRSSESRRLLMIHGDLRSTYKHRGQQVKQHSVTLQDRPSTESKHIKWLQDFQKTVKDLEISALMLSGVACDTVYDICDSLGIVVLAQVTYSLLVALGHVYQADYVTYIAQATQENILFPVQIEPLRRDWGADVNSISMSHMVVITPTVSPIQTVMLCHPCQSVAHLREEQFWQCAKRVEASLHGNQVVPGAGVSERWCSQYLQNYTEKSEHDSPQSSPYCAAIYRAVAEGFQQFAKLVTRNSQTAQISELSPQSFTEQMSSISLESLLILDDFESKVESWRTACHVASQILLTDVEIITGLEIGERSIAL